jgi:hypothetical protein
MYVIYDGEVSIMILNSLNVFEEENQLNQLIEDNAFLKFGKLKNTLKSG